MRHLALLILLCLPLTALADQVSMPGGRSYRIDLPADPQGAPILLALHGGGGSPDQFARNSGLSGPAIRAGYAVIYPQGSGRAGLYTWNGGYCCGHAARRELDDLAFLDAVVTDAASRFDLDAGRLYLTGMSNGAILAEAYAATRPTRVKAVAGVAGTLDLARFPPRGPVPLLHIHGLADRRVPYLGGPSGDGLTDTDFTPVPDVIAAFVATNGPGLASQAVTTGAVQETTWRRNARPWLRLIAITDGGHDWPGGRRAGPGALNANHAILTFFAAWP